FEETFYADAGVPVKFIGHPLVGAVHSSLDRKSFCREQRLNAEEPLIAFLPGSRKAELNQHLPVLRDACAKIYRETRAQFVLVAAPGADAATLREGWAPELPMRIV